MESIRQTNSKWKEDDTYYQGALGREREKKEGGETEKGDINKINKFAMTDRLVSVPK